MKKDKKGKSYVLIVETAKTLFWKHGVKRVSIEEISREAGVSKMTFYRLFKNKVDLVRQLLVSVFEEGLTKYKSVMASKDSFPEKVKQLILEKHKNTEGLSEEFIKDVFTSEQLQWQDVIHNYQKSMRVEMLKDFTKAQNIGWIRSDLSMEFIFYMLDDMQVKVNDARFLALHKDDLHVAIMEMTNFFFYGVIPLKEHRSE